MTRYDEAPYEANPIPCTAPEQLALASLLHGGPGVPIPGARMLEIGCADGANLLPLAFFRPDCRFVGVDISAVQIADARSSAERLALRNVTLHAADIREIAPELGEFDYIVAHGVMSWVPDAVRDAIFTLCRDHLSAHGLVYLSYNTNPGWLIRGLARRAMLQPRARRSLGTLTGEARERARALHGVIAGAQHPYAQLLAQELSRAAETSESMVLHDYLGPYNRAYWFEEFAARAAAFGLQYLVEAVYRMPEYRVPPPISQAARELETDPLKIETLIDVLWYRQHRASLFCRAGVAGAPVPLASLFDRVTIAAGCKPDSEPVRLEPGVEQRFTGLSEPNAGSMSKDPLDKAVLGILADVWPLDMRWRDLLTQSRQLLHDHGLEQPDGAAEAGLQQTLLDLHTVNQAELRLRALPVPSFVSYPPTLSPLTRWEVERRGMITTPTHLRVAIAPTDRVILAGLAGEQRPADVAREVVANLRAGGAKDLSESLTVEEWVDGAVADDLKLVTRWGLVQ